MRGQWIGNVSGQNKGLLMLNVDDRGTHFEGIAYLNVTNRHLPSTAATFVTANKERSFEFRTTSVLPINPIKGVVDSWDNGKQFYDPQIRISGYADVKGTWNDNFIELSWTTELGTQGSCKLPKSQADKPSNLHSCSMEWREFKEYVLALEGRRYLFRGQSYPWRLRTSFFRAGRADPIGFLNEDIQTLHGHLSARTKHVFRLNIPDENGAFFNLVQHHGYPTPLLDWTYSRYVAAFFAYREILNNKTKAVLEGGKVRIFVLIKPSGRNLLVKLFSEGRKKPGDPCRCSLQILNDGRCQVFHSYIAWRVGSTQQ
ncbi:MAG: FRG domain-containing protein [Nitrospira sp.]